MMPERGEIIAPNTPKAEGEQLDQFLAIGSEALRGLELIPEGGHESPWDKLPQASTSEFRRGNVLPTEYCCEGKKDSMQRRIAMARYFLRKRSKK